MSSGALSPAAAAVSVFQTGVKHLEEPNTLTFVKSIFGGVLLSSAGQFALTLSCGFPGLKETYPGLPRLLQGGSFPIGLIFVYFTGAELFTGYPMWYMLTALERKGRPYQYVFGPLTSWLGDLVGAVFVAGVFSSATGGLSNDPFRDGIIDEINEQILDMAWWVIFLRAVACGYLVTLAMYVGTQNHDGISKALGLYLPFFVSTVSKFHHTVEYMYIGALGLFVKTPGYNVGTYVGKCLVPVTLGNTVGGAFGTGLWLWWVYLKHEKEKGLFDGFARDGEYQDGDGEDDGEGNGRGR